MIAVWLPASEPTTMRLMRPGSRDSASATRGMWSCVGGCGRNQRTPLRATRCFSSTGRHTARSGKAGLDRLGAAELLASTKAPARWQAKLLGQPATTRRSRHHQPAPPGHGASAAPQSARPGRSTAPRRAGIAPVRRARPSPASRTRRAARPVGPPPPRWSAPVGHPDIGPGSRSPPWLPGPELAKTIKRYQQLILGAVEHGLPGVRSEATNTHLRLLTRRSYGRALSPSWPRPTSPAAACAHPSPAGQPHDHYPQKRQESNQPTHSVADLSHEHIERQPVLGWVDQRVRTGGVKLLPA
jgi:hypothetical protein